MEFDVSKLNALVEVASRLFEAENQQPPPSFLSVSAFENAMKRRRSSPNILTVGSEEPNPFRFEVDHDQKRINRSNDGEINNLARSNYSSRVKTSMSVQFDASSNHGENETEAEYDGMRPGSVGRVSISSIGSLIQRRLSFVEEPKNTLPEFRIGQQICLRHNNTWHAGRVLDISKEDFGAWKSSNLATIDRKLHVFVHWEGWSIDEDKWMLASSGRLQTNAHGITELNYGPFGKESERDWQQFAAEYKSEASVSSRRSGLAFDIRMTDHVCTCSEPKKFHPEHPDRLLQILYQIDDLKILTYVTRIPTRAATLEEVLTCHTREHVAQFFFGPEEDEKPDVDDEPEEIARKLQDRRSRLVLPPIVPETAPMACGHPGVSTDTVYNAKTTPLAARLAAGSLVDLVTAVATGQLDNGMAVIRPPGHHALPDQSMGFSFFNSVSIAVKCAKENLKLKRILIIDWDLHHGNGIQNLFYNDANVLYISLHRHDDGTFYPFTGAIHETGEGEGVGKTLNIAWRGGVNPPMTDVEYISAFEHIVIPVAEEFDPELVVVAAGFDAANGHDPRIGGYRLSTSCFVHMTRCLKRIAEGNVVLALEGGYHIPTVAAAAAACFAELVERDGQNKHRLPSWGETVIGQQRPCESAIKVMREVVAHNKQFWHCLDHIDTEHFKFEVDPTPTTHRKRVIRKRFTFSA